jgi:hypothetical protein
LTTCKLNLVMRYLPRIFFPAGISVSHDTVSEQVNRGRGNPRTSASRLRDAAHYFVSHTLLNPVYIGQTDIKKKRSFSRAI